MKLKLSCLLLISIAWACSEVPVPKPRGYIRADLPKHEYKQADLPCDFSFEIPKHAFLKEGSKDCHYTLWIPKYKAEMFLSYQEINETQSLSDLLEEMHQLTYQHQVKASAIESHTNEYPEQNKFILEYRLKGSVASPYQFCITDSVSHFFRGSFYFRANPNRDSTRVVEEYLDEEFQHLIESFEWKNSAGTTE